MQPTLLLVFRILQLVTAIAILGLAAYGITFWSFDGDDLTMFTAIATMIISIYIIVASTGAPIMYNYWAILGLDIFAIVFWITSFSLLASEVAAYQVVTYTTDTCIWEYDGYCYKNKRSMNMMKRSTTDVYTYRNAMAAASGLGGLEFIFFVVTLVITAVGLHRHRLAGGHCMPNQASTVATEQKNGAPVPVHPVQNEPVATV